MVITERRYSVSLIFLPFKVIILSSRSTLVRYLCLLDPDSSIYPFHCMLIFRFRFPSVFHLPPRPRFHIRYWVIGMLDGCRVVEIRDFRHWRMRVSWSCPRQCHSLSHLLFWAFISLTFRYQYASLFTAVLFSGDVVISVLLGKLGLINFID